MKKNEEEEPLIAGRYRVIKRAHLEERGVDERGTPVLVRPPARGPDGVAFIEQEELERTARVVASIESRWLLPVLCSTPRLVYAEPPPATRLGAFTPRDAAICLLQLCEVLARLHAAGWAGICTDVHNLRVAREGEGPRVTVVLPHLPSDGSYSAPWSPRASVGHDLQAATGFFRDLLAARVPARISRKQDIARAWSNLPALRPLGDESLQVMLTRMLAGEVADDLPADAASLAERLLPLAADSGKWAATVASLPRVRTVVVARRDWDRLIELGEAELASRVHANAAFVEMPLAAAFHQRACIAYAARDLTSALRDVRTAIRLDPWIRYFVTRGVVRDAMGDHSGARADYDRALTAANSRKPPEAGPMWIDLGWEGPGRAFERARATYARGVSWLKAGKVDEACGDLGEALALTLVLRERYGSPRISPSEEALGSLEGIIRRAQSAASRAKARQSGADPTN